MRFQIYRYNPETGSAPHMQDYALDPGPDDHMLLDMLMRIHAQDDSLAFRRSCREGICGSDAMNINGRNMLACVTKLETLKEPVVIRPLPTFPVIRDLVVDMKQFFAHYHAIKPYVISREAPPEKERLQSPQQREKLDGLYECILCACCTSFCPSSWWNPDRYLGPAALLQALRFIDDSRDDATEERLTFLDDVFRLYRCRSIMNCTEVCPMHLNPSQAIANIRLRMTRKDL